MTRRIWHPYWNWECFKYGMWRRAPRHEERELILKAIEFTGDADLYGAWMVKAVHAFKVSCEHHLSDASLNKQAYIGHAACALALQLPEYLVRKAWGLLTQEQRDKANRKADEAVDLWNRLRAGHGAQLDFGF